MNSLKRNKILGFVKFTSILFMTICFGIYWSIYSANNIDLHIFQKDNYAIILLFMILFGLFGKIYDAFEISINSALEIAYSQLLSALFSDGSIFVLTLFFTRSLPKIFPFIILFISQCLAALIWSHVVNMWYFKTFKPQKTAIIYDEKIEMESLIKKYNLEKKYTVLFSITAQECINNLDILDGIETVFIRGVHSKDRNVILKYCVENDIETLVIPRIGDVLMSSAKQIHMFHLPVLQIKRYNASWHYLILKRLFDIVLSLLAIIILSPIMLIVSVLIKLYDGGPVIYSQVRLTKDGKLFDIYKFRSMRTDAEKDGIARLSTGKNDNRITPVGKILRKYRLDELPQLFNILEGTLSICGPRPERPEIAKQYCMEMPEFALRLQAKAGLTGYAQVYGKYNTTPYDKLQMDLMYIAHPSIFEDIKIMFATVKILFMSESTDGIEEGQVTAIK